MFQSTPSLRRATERRRSGLGLEESFNPRPPCGERPTSFFRRLCKWLFQSTPSLRRATRAAPKIPGRKKVSIHALLAESDSQFKKSVIILMGFNPRPPCGERLIGASTNWGESDVSIHALLAESDALTLARLSLSPSFNPRPPCGERPIFCVDGVFFQQFQSTPSLRRATRTWDFVGPYLSVSIHALLAESDLRTSKLTRCLLSFNPRPPCGERLWASWEGLVDVGVSIHALLAESDIRDFGHKNQRLSFNPRPPCGERLKKCGRRPQALKFQSTPSLRRATHASLFQGVMGAVSIHALLAESDCPNGTCC